MTIRAEDLSQTPAAPAGRAEPVEIWRARNFIRDTLEEKLSLGRIAAVAKINPNYLSERFKEVTGENLVRYIARARTEKAIVLLRTSDRRVSEIAYAVGFQSLSQFNRVFRRPQGMTPTKFRARARNGANGQIPD